MPVPDELNDSSLEQLETDLLEKSTGNDEIRAVVLDVSSCEYVDLFSARLLFKLAKKLSLMDLDSVLVGLRPDVAITLVEMGLNRLDIKTAINLEHGLTKLKKRK